MRYISERKHKWQIFRDWALAALIIVMAILIWQLRWYDTELDKERELTDQALMLWAEKSAEVEEYRSAGFILIHSPVMIKEQGSVKK